MTERDAQSTNGPAGRFDGAYRSGQAPWDIGRPQAAFQELADGGRLVGRVLDVGCGTGEHTLMVAAMGLDATGVDSAPTAIAMAKAKARARELSARFLVWDAMRLPDLGEQFDAVLDCGLFHVFDDPQRPEFVQSLGASMPRGGRYFMLCFSDLEPGNWGPRRVHQDEIRECFRDGWQVEAIEPARLEITLEPGSVHAWLAEIVRA